MDLFEKLAISQLDTQLKNFPVHLLPNPQKGWINMMRKTLKISSYRLARFLGITQSSLITMEKREVDKAITLKSLEKVANFFDCNLVYAFIPRHSFEEMIKGKAREIALNVVTQTQQTMALENQSLSQTQLQKQIELQCEVILNDFLKDLWNRYEVCL